MTTTAHTRPSLVWAVAHTIGYTLWLLGQVILGAVAISRDMLRRRSHIEPVVVFYPLRITAPWQIFWLSTSVTMTPGTLSCGLRTVTTDHDTPGEAGTPQTMLIVQAVYGADPAEVLAGVADMEERLVPRVKDIDLGAPGQGSGHPVHSTLVAGHSDENIGPTETDAHHRRSAHEMPHHGPGARSRGQHQRKDGYRP